MSWEIVQRHHEEQKLIARNAVAGLQPLWGILDFHDLPGTTADWLRATRPMVERALLVSQYVAAQFVNSYRSALFPAVEPLGIELPNPLGAFSTPRIPNRHISMAIMVSLKVTGPVAVSKMMPMDESEAMAAGFSKSTGAATRLILNGGRGMVRLLMDHDPLAAGVAAVNDPEACNSCRFLSTPIMRTDGARKMDAVAVGHDFCKCSARLVY